MRNDYPDWSPLSIRGHAESVERNPKEVTVPHTVGQCEIDNHADTTCFGANFTALYFTEEVVDISTFSSEYAAMTD